MQQESFSGHNSYSTC